MQDFGGLFNISGDSNVTVHYNLNILQHMTNKRKQFVLYHVLNKKMFIVKRKK